MQVRSTVLSRYRCSLLERDSVDAPVSQKAAEGCGHPFLLRCSAPNTTKPVKLIQDRHRDLCSSCCEDKTHGACRWGHCGLEIQYTEHGTIIATSNRLRSRGISLSVLNDVENPIQWRLGTRYSPAVVRSPGSIQDFQVRSHAVLRQCLTRISDSLNLVRNRERESTKHGLAACRRPGVQYLNDHIPYNHSTKMNCPVCLDALAGQDTVVCTPCGRFIGICDLLRVFDHADHYSYPGHLYHLHCLHDSAEQGEQGDSSSLRCPTCRRSLQLSLRNGQSAPLRASL